MRNLSRGLAAISLLTLLACEADTDHDLSNQENRQASTQPTVLDIENTEDGPVVAAESAQDSKTKAHKPKGPSKNARAIIKKLPKSEFKTIEWTDLIPPEDLQALLNPPAYITDVEEGSLEDEASDRMLSTEPPAGDDPYQLALTSAKIIPEMDGKAIRIPGFVVPLEFDDNQMISQFFLVPFFGACIHVPPPPPNQIIFVDFPEGFQQRALFDPFWVSGVIKTDVIKNDVATAAYTMQMHYIERYEESEDAAPE